MITQKSTNRVSEGRLEPRGGQEARPDGIGRDWDTRRMGGTMRPYGLRAEKAKMAESVTGGKGFFQNPPAQART